MPLPHYELFAIKYATRDGRRAENFAGGDPHDAPMPLDYFVWLARSPGRTFVIDTGFTAEVAARRKRTFLRCPVRALAEFGVDAASVNDVIVTHMHYDHVGNFAGFPKARFHLQEREMVFATGRHMQVPYFAHGYEVEDVTAMVRINFARRVAFHDGAAEIAPGLSLHPAPGHTDGMQIVRVHTRRGWVVVASDATHFYENMETDRPFSTAFHLGDMVDSFRLLERLADSPAHIVPGHDPLVMQIYPPAGPGFEGVAVRLDLEPAPRP